MKKELAEDYNQKYEDIKVIATGGLLSIIAKNSDQIDYIDGMLTLNGLKLVYDKNKSKTEGKA